MSKRLISLGICILLIFPSSAQEGMWLLNQITQLNLAEKGLKIPVERIYTPGHNSLAYAVLQLDGGTASFVSPDGLILTNHHVAYTALQRISTLASDYLANGFLAAEHSDELPAPGYKARLMIEMKDVTDEVITGARNISDPVEKEIQIIYRIAEMCDEISKTGSDLEAEIIPMYSGRHYILFKYKVFKDVRVVYAPPSSVGNYGGETDNWMWPRHSGDFAFMRVYVNSDGNGADYNTGNIPYKPEIWLRTARGDMDEGDFNFIIGYPAVTSRYRSSSSVSWNLNNSYPFYIENFSEIISLAGALVINDPEGRLRTASFVKDLANELKYYQGVVGGMKKTEFLRKKLESEKEFLEWVNDKSEKRAKYADIIIREKELYNLLENTKDRDNVFSLLQGLSGTLPDVASRMYEISVNDNFSVIPEGTLNEIKGEMELLYNDFFEPLDKALLVRTLKLSSELTAGQRIKGLDLILSGTNKSPEQWVEELYANTKFKDFTFVKSLIENPSKIKDYADDPFLRLAAAIYPESEEIRMNFEAFTSKAESLRKDYYDALFEWHGDPLYPDANGTIRFTWGKVKGYRPADAVWYSPFTTLRGVIEKDTDREPFDAPLGLTVLEEGKDFGEWADPELNDVPVAFLNQCDITGGNSGSPVMNSKGELAGLAFDGNYESLISDWQYDYDLQRCIAVDIRYVLFITEKLGKAGFLLREMEGDR